ncbi:MAG: hypothetical protein K6D02_05140 [Lachnospiraceae bacterium]|nr:hypothetical protein [Lachnospiraceae bacterium]
MTFTNDICNYIRSGETTSKNLGLEIEHFVVDDNGDQISFELISSLIEEIGNNLGASLYYTDGYVVGYNTDEYCITLEPSCQFEISINPYYSIDKIRQVYDEFYKLWKNIFDEYGYHIETYGNLPKVELGIIKPDDIPLSPKKRYKYMDKYFMKSGKYGKYMMRASASTQISVDYSSEKDMIRKLQVLEKISPLLMIIMESKSDIDSILDGERKKPHLHRIQEWEDLDSARTGFISGSLDKNFGYNSMSSIIYNTPLILLTDNSKTVYVGDKSAKDLIKDKTIDNKTLTDDRKNQLIEHFISMGFFHFRVKKYIEIRVADSVPINRALGYVALIKGLIYSEENLEVLEKEFELVDSISEIEAAVEEIEKYGFDAIIYNNKNTRELVDFLIELSKNGLDNQEKEYVDNVRSFWSYSQ